MTGRKDGHFFNLKSNKMYKLKQQLPSEFKIKVNPQQSEALQKHLFSLGYTFGANKDVILTDKRYLYIWRDKSICTDSSNCEFEFKDNNKPRIKFKDYFEKETLFPEKWCILVTEDNYKELNTWMHRNWKNYKNYTDKWKVKVACKPTNYFFTSCSKLLGHSVLQIANGYELITTEQFRKQFGDLNPKGNESEQSHNLRKELVSKIWKLSEQRLNDSVDYFRMSLINENGVLPLEIKRLKKENEQLKKYNQELQKQVNSYYHKLTMLNEKLEMIKNI
jgi:hypothetical protein